MQVPEINSRCESQKWLCPPLPVPAKVADTPRVCVELLFFLAEHPPVLFAHGPTLLSPGQRLV